MVSNLAHLFEPEPNHNASVAADDAKVKTEDHMGYIWTDVDVESFEGVNLVGPLDRLDLNALLFLKQLLKH